MNSMKKLRLFSTVDGGCCFVLRNRGLIASVVYGMVFRFSVWKQEGHPTQVMENDVCSRQGPARTHKTITRHKVVPSPSVSISLSLSSNLPISHLYSRLRFIHPRIYSPSKPRISHGCPALQSIPRTFP